MFRQHLLTVPAAAAAIRAEMRLPGASTGSTLRFVREMINNSRLVATDADRGAFFAEPSTTGDRRWDALLAAVVDRLTGRLGMSAPEWTLGRSVLPLPFWFVGSTPALHAYAFSHSPVEMATRGVFIDPADLESV